MTEVKSQSSRNTCASFTLIALLEYEIKKHSGNDVNLSEEYLHYSIKKEDNSNHSEITSMMKCTEHASKNGVLFENDWPYVPSFYNRGYPCEKNTEGDSSTPFYCNGHFDPPADIKQKQINLKFDVTRIPMSIRKITTWIYEKNQPCAFIFPIIDTNWISNYGHVTVNRKRYYETTEHNNHYAIICGYDLKKEVFFIRNSYGKEWGNNGYGTISFSDFRKYAGAEVLFINVIDTNSFKIKEPLEPFKTTVSFENIEATTNPDQSITLKLQGFIDSLGRRNIEIRSYFIVVHENGKKFRIELLSNEVETVDDYYVCHVWRYRSDSAFITKLIWDEKNPLTILIPNNIVFKTNLQKFVADPNTRIQLLVSYSIGSDTVEDSENNIIFLKLDKSALLKQ